MCLSICFTRRFIRLCDELKIPTDFLKTKIESYLKNSRKKINAKRLYFDTHGNLKISKYEELVPLISIITYSVEKMSFNLKRKNFLRDLLHELRHFQQDRIYGWDMDEYSLKDINEGNSTYYKSKIEIDARKYEKRSLKLYQEIRKRYG
jgi:hypothetical protein